MTGALALATLVACSRPLVTLLLPDGRVALQSSGARLFYRLVLRCLPLTRQAPETARRVPGGRLSPPDPGPAAAPPKVSTIDSARGLLHRELPRRYIAHSESIAQQKNNLLFAFFIHSLPPQLIHRESPGEWLIGSPHACLMSRLIDLLSRSDVTVRYRCDV